MDCTGVRVLRDSLGQMVVVEPSVARQYALQVFAADEVVASQHLFDPTIEAFDHPVGLWPAGSGQPMLDAKRGAQRIEDVLARGCALARGIDAVGELLAVIGQDRADAQRASLDEGSQEGVRGPRTLEGLDLDEHPARGAIDGHKQVAAPILIGHLRQILHVDVNKARLVRGKGCMRRPLLLRLQHLEVADTMAAQAAV